MSRILSTSCICIASVMVYQHCGPNYNTTDTAMVFVIGMMSGSLMTAAADYVFTKVLKSIGDTK